MRKMGLELVDPDDVERLLLNGEDPPAADEVRARQASAAPLRGDDHWRELARAGGITPATEDPLGTDRTDDGPGEQG